VRVPGLGRVASRVCWVGGRVLCGGGGVAARGRGPPQQGLALAELHNKIFMPHARDMRRIRPCTLYMCTVQAPGRCVYYFGIKSANSISPV
jgi:hypothetical protein